MPLATRTRGQRLLGPEQLRRPDRRASSPASATIALSGITPRGRGPSPITFAKPTLAAAERVVVSKSATSTTIAALNKPSVKFCGQSGTGSGVRSWRSTSRRPRSTSRARPTACSSSSPARLTRRSDRQVTGNGWLKAHPGSLKLVADQLAACPRGPRLGRSAARRSRLRGVHQRALRRVHQQRASTSRLFLKAQMGYKPDMAALMTVSEATSRYLAPHDGVAVAADPFPWAATAPDSADRARRWRLRAAGTVQRRSTEHVVDRRGREVVRRHRDPARREPRRERVARSSSIIGASGSGKTTLLRCVAGLEPIQGGRIDVFGTHVRRVWQPARRGRLRLPALQSLPAHDGPRERAARARQGAEMRRRAAREAALESLRLVGMDSFAGARPARLSEVSNSGSRSLAHSR